ncbi:MAG: LemA family protein [Verrucomicrobiales bacterium]|jgi:LemA protein|nr:LemA family protein [Verrucomicrobiales bacterium]
MPSFLVISAATAFVAVILIIFLFNSLIAKRNAVDFAFSCIDTQLKKRCDLIPNLIATVKGYANHEAGVLREVTELRNQLINQQSATNDRFALETQLTEKLPALMAVAEAYPNLKADQQFLHLQRTLTEIEEQISAARRAFNAATYEYNNAVQSFPSNLIAGTFQFRARDFFHINDTERQNPAVSV